MRKKVTVLLWFVCVSFTLFGGEAALKERMKSELDTLNNIFLTQYAPFEWKRDHGDWDLQLELATAKAKIDSKPSIQVKDFQQILKGFTDSVGDYHVSLRFYSTEMSNLPFLLKSAHGRYFIAAVNRPRLAKGMNLSVGDEVTAVNGIPIQEAITAFQIQSCNKGATATDRAFSEIYFSQRFGSQGHETPEGPFNLTIKGKKGASRTLALQWDHVREQIPTHFPIPHARHTAPAALFSTDSKPLVTLRSQMKTPLYELVKPLEPYFAGHTLGGRTSFLPPLGDKIWDSGNDSHFYAYIFKDKIGRSIGCIRIPHYTGDESTLKEFEQWITLFQQSTDGLVIDQLNNPGGSVFYMYSLASMLTSSSLKLPTHQISLTQKEIADALEVTSILEGITTDEEARQVLGETVEGLPVNRHFAQKVQEYFKAMIAEWGQGKYTTQPLYLYGMDKVEPHKTVRYTKPILILINALDISCGDFFPAIMQDNKRAVLFGAKTAGAGGFVLAAEYPNLFGLEVMSYTGSMAKRLDNTPIESIGVTPDIPYELTVEDLKQNYIPYVEAVHKALSR